METTSIAASTAFDHQQVSKNKRKKFNPQYMQINSSSDNDEENVSKDDDDDRMNDVDQSSSDEHLKTDDNADSISNTNFSITKDNNGFPPPASSTPFMPPSKMSLFQTFNLQQQLQQAAISAIAPQFSQQMNSSHMSLSETEAKFREFAFKTMQELLQIYGLSLPPNEILEAMKNQQSECSHLIICISPKTEQNKAKFDILIQQCTSRGKLRVTQSKQQRRLWKMSYRYPNKARKYHIKYHTSLGWYWNARE